MRKGRDGGEEKKQGKTNENSGHYVVCQQSTARTTTAGTPHARAKSLGVGGGGVGVKAENPGLIQVWQYSLLIGRLEYGVNNIFVLL